MIFYFTATGNSLATAKWIGEKTGEGLMPMGAGALEKDWTGERTVGFVFPTFFYSAPGFVLDFMERVRISPEAYIFLVNTCGGDQGNSLHDAAGMLEHRGLRVSFARSLTLPDNTAMLRGSPFRKRTLKTHRMYTDAIATDVAERDVETADRRSSAVKALGTKIGGPSMRFMGRHLKADRDRCVGCGICTKVCPRDNIRLTEGRPEFGRDCISCLSCFHWCPEAAIRVSPLKAGKERQYHHPSVGLDDIIAARAADSGDGES